MFRVDLNQRKDELIDEFSKKVGKDSVLVKCLVNKLECRCTYLPEIEQQIRDVCATLELIHREPPWLSLLD